MCRRYPLGPADDDPRFTFGLIVDVARVLAEHGYPPMSDEYAGIGRDLSGLQQALFGFLYALDPVSEVSP